VGTFEAFFADGCSGAEERIEATQVRTVEGTFFAARRRSWDAGDKGDDKDEEEILRRGRSDGLISDFGRQVTNPCEIEWT